MAYEATCMFVYYVSNRVLYIGIFSNGQHGHINSTCPQSAYDMFILRSRNSKWIKPVLKHCHVTKIIVMPLIMAALRRSRAFMDRKNCGDIYFITSDQPRKLRKKIIFPGWKLACVILRSSNYIYAKNHIDSLLHFDVKDGQTN